MTAGANTTVIPAKNSRAYSLREIFRIPLWLFALSLFGLVVALIGDGWLDVLSWLTLVAPLLVAWRMWHLAVVRVRTLRAEDAR